MNEELLAEVTAALAETATDETRRAGLAGLLDAIAARPGERAEDVLLDLKLADDRTLALTLAMRSGRRFEGLRGFEADARLFLYLPLALARRERVLPIVLVGDALMVASAYLDPDLSYLDERFPRLRLELVVAPRSEILEALRSVDA